MFIHVVLFWLTDPATAAELEADALSLLAKIPGVTHCWAGKPAMTPREVVDNSYHVGLCVVMPDSAAHDVYQAHELHQEFLRRHKAKFARVQIYDFA